MKQTLLDLIPIVLPLFLGWLIKAPWMRKYVSPQTVSIIEMLTPGQFKELTNILVTSSKRREAAVEFTRSKLREYGIEVNEATAEAMYDYVVARFKAR